MILDDLTQSGLYSATMLCLGFWACLEDQAAMERADFFRDARVGEAYIKHVCVQHAPGQESYFPFVMLCEIIRAVVLLIAAALLAGGTAWGGDEEARTHSHASSHSFAYSLACLLAHLLAH